MERALAGPPADRIRRCEHPLRLIFVSEPGPTPISERGRWSYSNGTLPPERAGTADQCVTAV
jgi:hypothetical protein